MTNKSVIVLSFDEKINDDKYGQGIADAFQANAYIITLKLPTHSDADDLAIKVSQLILAINTSIATLGQYTDEETGIVHEFVSPISHVYFPDMRSNSHLNCTVLSEWSNQNISFQDQGVFFLEFYAQSSWGTHWLWAKVAPTLQYMYEMDKYPVYWEKREMDRLRELNHSRGCARFQMPSEFCFSY